MEACDARGDCDRDEALKLVQRGARKFKKRMQAAGGDFTVDVLPESGIFGNGHTMMLEKNNKVIMQRMITWMRAHVYKAE